MNVLRIVTFFIFCLMQASPVLAQAGGLTVLIKRSATVDAMSREMEREVLKNLEAESSVDILRILGTAGHGATIEKIFSSIDRSTSPNYAYTWFKLELSDYDSDVETLCQRFAAAKYICQADHQVQVNVEEDESPCGPTVVPQTNDFLGSFQWGLQRVFGREANAIAEQYQGNSPGNVVIAVLDSGIDLLHPDFINLSSNDSSSNYFINLAERAGNLVDDDGNGLVDDVIGWNFIDNTTFIDDDNGHGTAVSSIIINEANNGLGGAGLSDSVMLLPIKVIGQDNQGSLSTVARGIEYALEQLDLDHNGQVDSPLIINLSLGCPRGVCIDSFILDDAVRRAHQHGALVVSAAGNSNADSRFISPAYLPEALAVASINPEEQRSSFSNFGAVVDIAAPGSQQFVSVPRFLFGPDFEPYTCASGTSFAAPYVSAAASLIWAVNPSLSNIQVQELLVSTSRTLQTDQPIGGLLNAALATVRAVPSVLAIGSGPGFSSEIKLYFGTPYSLREVLRPFNSAFKGGINTAVGDVNGDNIPDIITAPFRNGGPHVKVFDTVTQSFIYSDFAYRADFGGGVFLASGDTNNDGRDEIITGAGLFGTHVKVIDAVSGVTLRSFFAYNPALQSGVRVASGVDFNRDGHDDIVTAPGKGGGPHVKIFSGRTGAVIASFFAYNPALTTGLFIAVGDLNGDGIPELVTAPDAGGGPHVKVFDMSDLAAPRKVSDIFAYNASFGGGVRVAVNDATGDGKAELITAPGATGGPHVKSFSYERGQIEGQVPRVISNFFAFDASMTSGISLGG